MKRSALTPTAEPPTKKRKAEDDAVDTDAKKTKTVAKDEDQDGEEDGEDDADEAPEEDDADEQEGEEDEPAVKTKVVGASEPKTAAAEVDDEEYEKED